MNYLVKVTDGPSKDSSVLATFGGPAETEIWLNKKHKAEDSMQIFLQSSRG